jgi:transcriptional activator SPT8
VHADCEATDGQNISPVYSLAVHSQALWLLAGTESGGINLQAVRHEEGKRIHYLKQHTSAVSVLNLARDERSVLSGSWDKLVMDWDLNTGSVKRTFDGAGGQISAIEMRPASSIPVPESSSDPLPSSDTFSSNNDAKPSTNGDLSNGTKQDTTADNSGDGAAQSAASPLGSLFGEDDNGSLFGDNDTSMGGNNNGFGGDADDDDEFSRAVANGVAAPENDDDGAGDVSMIDVGPSQEDTSPQQHSGERGPTLSQTNGALPTDGIPPSTAAHTTPLTNGLPHALDTEPRPPEPLDPPPTTAAAQESTTTDDTTFLAASIDGSIRVWDKRQPAPLAKIVSRNAPPWCMGACWSPDGNYIYAGRRNGTVEEFSLHKGFREASRTFKFPNGSGPVSAVRAMPNGRHLVW